MGVIAPVDIASTVHKVDVAGVCIVARRRLTAIIANIDNYTDTAGCSGVLVLVFQVRLSALTALLSHIWT